MYFPHSLLPRKFFSHGVLLKLLPNTHPLDQLLVRGTGLDAPPADGILAGQAAQREAAHGGGRVEDLLVDDLVHAVVAYALARGVFGAFLGGAQHAHRLLEKVRLIQELCVGGWGDGGFAAFSATVLESLVFGIGQC
jgi:hypothetical protein